MWFKQECGLAADGCTDRLCSDRPRALSRGAILVHPSGNGLVLMFAAGNRPSASDIEHLLASPDRQDANAGILPAISHRPDDDAGWLELLSNGLTFDLVGLAPGDAAPTPDARHRFGLRDTSSEGPLEATGLVDGPHIVAGAAMLPVVRTLIGIAVGLCSRLTVQAVCWGPAQSWMEPGYFTRIAARWLNGGVFPALGLAALEQSEEGALVSQGLSFFVGQEVVIEPLAGESRADTVKRAIRLMDLVVRQGGILATQEVALEGADEGSTVKMLARPSQGGELVRFGRGS